MENQKPIGDEQLQNAFCMLCCYFHDLYQGQELCQILGFVTDTTLDRHGAFCFIYIQ